MSDNGTPFTSNEFEGFCKSNGICDVQVAPYHLASNRLAEHTVRIFKEADHWYSARLAGQDTLSIPFNTTHYHRSSVTLRTPDGEKN